MADVAKLRKEFKDLISRLTDDDWEKWHDGLDERIEKQKQEVLVEASWKTIENQLAAFTKANVNARFKTGPNAQLHFEGVQHKAHQDHHYTFVINFLSYAVGYKQLSAQELIELSQNYHGRSEVVHLNSLKTYSRTNESQLFAF